ncbi:respiratory nitrate reductase subunit gamma [Blastochloris sulfoviridis]|uniref:Nitrate reductase n=1 Tax=Blastochloris sulfoviridis TaxID=50712 RepID=A0A5M6I3J5_9HYPH|nr:respiratory nitrate reductase subunit gamma [Blastochloris sulfoviridis]KAA5602419.1 nitrate reductase [Blastochloris sulfoviridis]
MANEAFVVLAYAVALIFAGGLAYRVWQYATTPVPLKIPTTPAPVTRAGAAARMLREVALFESLFRSNKWTWLFGWVFHVSLALVVLRHLRYVLEPVPLLVQLIQPLGVLAGFTMVGALLALWARRLLVPRVRVISGPSDHLMLALLVAIGASGLAMTYVARTDIVAVKAFWLGLVHVDWQPLPTDPALLVHLGLVAVLALIFPFSKLLHGVGVWFSPSRNQADDARERRHTSPAGLAPAVREG